jgi:hypothetical protein
VPKFLRELQYVAIRILGQVIGSAAAERDWKDYKWVCSKIRNRLGNDKVHKHITVNSCLRLQDKQLSGWEMELAKFTEADEMLKLDEGIVRAANDVVLIDFKNFQEACEHAAMTTKNAANTRVLKDKYLHMYFHDADEDIDELRRIVDIEWKKRQGRMPAQHVAVTQLVRRDGEPDLNDPDTMEPYFFNEELYVMIAGCPDPYNKNVRLVDA